MRVVFILTLAFVFLLNTRASAAGASDGALSLQCVTPRKDIFTYTKDIASVVEEWTDGTMHPRKSDLVGFDPDLLKAVFYTVFKPGDPVGLIIIFEINFANPAVIEHRIGPDVKVSFEFKGCRRIN